MIQRPRPTRAPGKHLPGLLDPNLDFVRLFQVLGKFAKPWSSTRKRLIHTVTSCRVPGNTNKSSKHTNRWHSVASAAQILTSILTQIDTSAILNEFQASFLFTDTFHRLHFVWSLLHDVHCQRAYAQQYILTENDWINSHMPRSHCHEPVSCNSLPTVVDVLFNHVYTSDWE